MGPLREPAGLAAGVVTSTCITLFLARLELVLEPGRGGVERRIRTADRAQPQPVKS
jgi:hypothetical protein